MRIGNKSKHFEDSNLLEKFTFLTDTTRSKKSYEMDGREYHYVSKETFESLMYSHR